MGFTEYMITVDLLFCETYGMGFDNFPDIAYRTFFEDGLTPEDVLEQFMGVYPEYRIQGLTRAQGRGIITTD